MFTSTCGLILIKLSFPFLNGLRVLANWTLEMSAFGVFGKATTRSTDAKFATPGSGLSRGSITAGSAYAAWSDAPVVSEPKPLTLKLAQRRVSGTGASPLRPMRLPPPYRRMSTRRQQQQRKLKQKQRYRRYLEDKDNVKYPTSRSPLCDSA